VHWLTWREIADLFRTWQGLTLASVSFLATLYYGPRKMLETWDWYLDRLFHSKVRHFLHGKVTTIFKTAQGDTVYGELKTVDEIAKGTNLPEQRVRKSLVALQRKKEVVEEDGKWRTPHRAAI
jgi:hypothetical protein